MRGVADELALRLDRLAEPLGHVVEGERDLALLARTRDLGARIELAVLDASRRSGERAQRPRERAGEHPGEREPERERGEPDADDDEHVPAHALAAPPSSLCVTRTAPTVRPSSRTGTAV